MNTSTTWLEGVKDIESVTLKKDLKTDVVVVGAGIAGVLSAYMLSKAGKKVAIIEKGGLEDAVTAYTTAFITYVIDTDASDLIKMYGKDKTSKIWKSGAEGIDLIEKIVKDENIDCEFERVSEYMYALTDGEVKDLEEMKDTAHELGFTHKLGKGNDLGFKTTGVLEVPDQAKFHPLKFVVALKEIMKKRGVEIYQNTEALSLKSMKKDGKETTMVETKHGSVSADFCIVATYKPFNKPRELFAHTGPYVSFVFELEIPKGVIKDGMYIDLRNPYHYIRVDKKNATHDRLVIGGEDHRKEVPMPDEKNYRALEDYIKEIMPDLKYTIEKKWVGTMLENIDGLPYIGSYSTKHPHELAATGFSGNGMQFSAIAAQIFHDRILGKPNPYAAIYNVHRGTRPYNFMKKFLDYAGELFGGYVKNLFK